MADVIFEPRAFWDVSTVPVTSGNTSPQTTVTDPNHFYNGERYPITIDTIVVSMINYVRKSFQDSGGAPGPASGYDALSNILAGFKLVLSARQRQSYSRYPVDASMFVNTPADLLVPTPADDFSSFYGTIHRKFEPHLMVPKNGTVQFDMTPFAGYAPGLLTNLTSVTIAFHELGTLIGGNIRQFRHPLLDAVLTAGGVPFGPIITPQALQASQAAGAAPTTALWPPQHTINPRTWKAQSPAAQGSAEFTGMSVMIDQIDYDDSNIAAATTPSPFAMLATRIGCRMRLTDGGTKAWFWRPGAPLVLVFPDITPALVCKLDKPITLGPGEQLEVELTTPAVTLNPSNVAMPTTYQFGIALNGYAAIEG